MPPNPPGAPPGPHSTTVLVIFALVYAGMLLGRLPRLQMDRTGIALLGAIALLGTGGTSLALSRDAVHLPTLVLLFSMMVVSGQLRLGGFYRQVTATLGGLRVGPVRLLGALVAVAGFLSAMFTNDVVCIAMARILLDVCVTRRLDPVPFLLGLACASNVGSAATLIGNPQNMLIGQTFSISFTGYLRTAAIPAALGLVAVWAVLCIAYRGRWERECAVVPDEERPKPDRGQTVKGLLVAAGLLAAFLFAPWPREVVSLSGAAILLTSRRLHTRRTLGYVDWQVLVLFIGLFVVNDALARTGMPARVVDALAASGFDLARAEWLFAVTAILSNVVSNVPAVMLLLPLCGGPAAGPDLALASTLAGNLLVVGSIANILVVDIAARRGIPISWRAHARIGIPVTLVTLLLAVAWRVATA